MKRKKVLIFPAGTEIAFEIWNSLKYSKFVELYGANSEQSHADFVFKNCDNSIPYEDASDFIDRLNALIDRWEIDYIYPAHDNACLTLTKEQKRLHASVVTSPFRTVDICRSKSKTYDFFWGEPFLPLYYRNIDEVLEYPVFIKPAVGQGSVGARKIGDSDELKEALSVDTEYVICEYLPGDEYTVDCFTDRWGVLRSCHIRQRERIRTGISVRSTLLPIDADINEIANRINTRLEFNGAWFFQVKRNLQGKYRLMEISARIPGTMGTSRNLGINYPLLTLFNMWGYDIEIIDNHCEITLDRAFINRYKMNIEYKRVYIDFDDTLYLNEAVNITVIAFLYQCTNKGIPVTLITKHSGSIEDSLKNYKISDLLFDEIIHLAQDEDKSKYVKENNSIFIDDSFTERANIRRKIGIPVFDLDMIESLLDWRM